MLTDGGSPAAFYISAVAQDMADYYLRQGGHVIAGVCLSVCLPQTQKVMNGNLNEMSCWAKVCAL